MPRSSWEILRSGPLTTSQHLNDPTPRLEEDVRRLQQKLEERWQIEIKEVWAQDTCSRIYIYIYTVTDRIMEKKKRFNLQAPPVYDRKVTNLFFSIIIFSIIIFFSIILSVP